MKNIMKEFKAPKNSFKIYINHRDLINGFLLILDDSLPYNHPDGAALIGLTRDESFVRDKNNKIIPKLTEYFYKTVYELNADDKSYVLPQFIVECINERNEFSLMIDQLKKKYYNLVNVKVTRSNSEVSFEEIRS